MAGQRPDGVPCLGRVCFDVELIQEFAPLLLAELAGALSNFPTGRRPFVAVPGKLASEPVAFRDEFFEASRHNRMVVSLAGMQMTNVRFGGLKDGAVEIGEFLLNGVEGGRR